MMVPGSRVFVAGHRGLAGSAIVRALRARGYGDIACRTRSELDLADVAAVDAFFGEYKPEFVFLAAARVGGILANASAPAEFIHQNLVIQSSVIHACHVHGVKKLMFLGSSCIYPKLAAQPMRESALMSGPIEATNEAYAVAKIAGIKMCAAYNRQYRTDFMCAQPTNLYGPGDNYDSIGSHVMAALIRKAHEAKLASAPHMLVWGTGAPLREFLYSDDLADALVFLMERHTALELGELVNIGCGSDISIRELATLIAREVGYRGELRFDASKPDGTPRKLLDVGRMSALGWRARTGLAEGVRMAYRDFLSSRWATPAVESALA